MDAEKHPSKIREHGKPDPRERLVLLLLAVAFLSIIVFGGMV